MNTRGTDGIPRQGKCEICEVKTNRAFRANCDHISFICLECAKTCPFYKKDDCAECQNR